MTEVVAWLVFPAALSLLGLGCGLLVERAGGRRLPGVLLLPLGLALIAVVADLLTRLDATSEAAMPAVVVLALLGALVSAKRIRGLRLDFWAVAAGLLPFVALMAPVVSSGAATFTGYTILDDTSIHLTLVEQVFARGHDVSPDVSSFTTAAKAYLATDYPLGADLPLGVGWQLVGGEVGGLFQPWLGLLLASVALAVYSLLEPTPIRRWQRAIVAGVTAQPGLLYAFGLQGSVKELATVWIFTLVVALAVPYLRDPGRVLRALPLAVAVAAGLVVLSLAIVPWIGVPLAVTAVLAVLRAPKSRLSIVRSLGVGAALAGLLALPSLVGALTFARVASGVLTKTADLGNLASPLDPLQIAGIWPRGDYRLALAPHRTVVYVLIAVAVLAAIAGVVWLVRRRRVEGPALLALGAGAAVLYLLRQGSPYADAKTLAVGSPAVTLLALLGAAALVNHPRRVRRVAGAALALVVIGGIAWTNALAYRQATLAPAERFEELADLGDRLAGQGPTLFDEYDEHAKHLLRRAGGASAPETLHRYADLQTTREETSGKRVHDLDRMDWRYVTTFPRIVLRRSPVASRPPSGYELEWSGRYYEAWRRVGLDGRVVAHVPGGNALSSEPQLTCRRIQGIARRAGALGQNLRYAPRSDLALFVPGRAPVRPSWSPDSQETGALHSIGEGTVRGRLALERGGRYRVWLGGSFARAFEARIDGRDEGEVDYELGWPGQSFELGSAELPAGERAIEVGSPGPNLRGGDGHQGRLSNLVLAPARPDRSVRRLDPSRARSLCGRDLDWVEVVSP